MTCRELISGFFSVVVLQTLLVVPTQAGTTGGWQADFTKAEAEAKRLRVPLLLHFHASWCGPCRQMESQVLSSAELKRRLGDKIIGVKIDIDAHPELGRRFRVNALPSDVIVSPEGKTLHQTEGFQAKDAYLANVSRFESRIAAKPVKPEAPAVVAASRTETAAPKLHSVTQPLHLDSGTALAMDGYCPVTLWKTRQWKRGAADYAFEYQGVKFQFTGKAELDEFKAAPAQFAPQLLGCDPVVLLETDRAIPGKTLYGAFYDGELYLFETLETRAKFKTSPPRYTRTRHVLKLDELEKSSRG
jgi:thiol-disulfide isomerase/thioredoxin/YHS domain-containing protein